MIRVNQVLSMVLGAFTGLAIYDAGRKDGQAEGEINGWFKGVNDGISAEPVVISEGAKKVLDSSPSNKATEAPEPETEALEPEKENDTSEA